jgi:hypothetical protein
LIKESDTAIDAASQGTHRLKMSVPIGFAASSRGMDHCALIPNSPAIEMQLRFDAPGTQN